jgi:hypothetical protein
MLTIDNSNFTQNNHCIALVRGSEVSCTNIKEKLSEKELIDCCISFINEYVKLNYVYPVYVQVVNYLETFNTYYWVNFSETGFWLETISKDRLYEILFNTVLFNNNNASIVEDLFDKVQLYRKNASI